MAEAEESEGVVDEPQAEEAPDTDDEIIWPLPGVKRRRMAYIPLPGVLGIFPEVSPATLCELADLKTVSPSRVLAIVPTATVAQLCDFCKLAESLQAPDNAVDQPPHVPDPLPVQEKSGPVADLLAELKKLRPRFAWVIVLFLSNR